MNGYRRSFDCWSHKTSVEYEFLWEGYCLIGKSVFWIGAL